MKRMIILLVISLLFCCNRQKSTEHSKAEVYSDAVGNKIVFLESYFTDYLNAIKVDYKYRDEYYKEKIAEPVSSKYFSKAEYYTKDDFSYPIEDTNGLANYISGIALNHKKIEDIISTTLKECNKYLKDDSLTICIMPSTNYKKEILQKMGGVTGITFGSKQILVIIDASVNGWDNNLQYCIAHEFNHAYWAKVNFTKSFKFTLLNDIISEGNADSYAHFLYPKEIKPWDDALSDPGKVDLWNRIKPELNSEDQAIYMSVMFGSANYPLWGGYTLGYAIVQSVLKNNPNLTPEQWTNLPAEEILKMSDYKLQ